MKSLSSLYVVVGLVLLSTPLCCVQKEFAQKTKSARAQKTTKPLAHTSKAVPTEKQSSAKLEPIDRIEAVIFGSETTDIVTSSDIMRVGFDGRIRTREEIILERLKFQDALRYRIMVDEKTVDNYIEKVAKNYGGTVDDVKKMFEQAGYTFEEGRRQFAIMFGANQVVDFKIRSRLNVPEKDIESYYEEHPVIKPASYVIELAFVYAAADNRHEVHDKVDAFIKTGQGLTVGWQQLPEIAQADLAEDKKFITQLKPGEIGPVQEVEGGFELVRLKSKKSERLVPLEERYRDIVSTLRQPKFDEQLKEYHQTLLKNASVLYL